jgi:hypothetical protein
MKDAFTSSVDHTPWQQFHRQVSTSQHLLPVPTTNEIACTYLHTVVINKQGRHFYCYFFENSHSKWTNRD